MSKLLGWNGAALLALGLVLGGCGGPGNKVCTANQMSCLNSTIELTCNAKGTALVPTTCGVGETCTAGACAADPTAACTAADDQCTDSTHALVCTTMGASSVACPTGTTCTGAGVCQGTCAVGSSMCTDNGTLVTCTDGFHYVSIACGAGMGCVQTSSTPSATAACLAADCMPDDNGCGAVCGDKSTAGTGTATNTVSTCVATPLGFKWVATACTAPQMCNSTGATCGSGAQAACAAQCNPGDTQCRGTSGFVTCGADGTWGTAVTACNTSTFTCFQSTAGEAVCGDFACAAPAATGATVINEVAVGQGACDATGQFHACGTDGRVSATAQACATGLCSASTLAVGAYAPGTCVTECQAGDSRCIYAGSGGASYQACTNGIWGTVKTCANGSLCNSFTTPSGRPQAYCECVPGTHQCGPSGGIEMCSTDGTWGAETACAMGACTGGYHNAGGAMDAACITECFPGKSVCVGDTASVPNLIGVTASQQTATCLPDGTLPTDTTTFTACDAGKYCRTGPAGGQVAGTYYGCVTCVGIENEQGSPDAYCGSSTTLDVCSGDSTGFTATTCTAGTATCFDPKLRTCSLSLEQARGEGYTNCPYGDLGSVCGVTSDCCSNFCSGTATTQTAYCR